MFVLFPVFIVHQSLPLFFALTVILPHTVYGIARKTVQGAERSHSQLAVNTVSHSCRMQFIPRFSCDWTAGISAKAHPHRRLSRIFQDPQPVQIILVALVLFHQEFQQNASLASTDEQPITLPRSSIL